MITVLIHYKVLPFAFFFLSILIDDRDSLRETWEQAGGVFVHHVDAETTIQKLKDHGIL
jgi:hypothetical protein